MVRQDKPRIQHISHLSLIPFNAMFDAADMPLPAHKSTGACIKNW
ncbi:MAG: hypothetical protein ACI9KM_001686 [Rubritalea sp.]|jgi:hypothetical protein